jgi:hypothetical protein
LVAQSPAGATGHVVSVKGNSGDYEEVAVLSGSTSGNQWLEVPLPGPIEDVRFVGIETFESPSWIAWRETSIMGS